MVSKHYPIPEGLWKEESISLYKNDVQIIDVVRQLIEERSSHLGTDEAFFVMNLGYFVDAARQWKQLLPRVHPFFAVKANDDPVLMYLMKELNFGFDCSSLGEVQKVLELGVHPSKIIYANPHKQASHLRTAASLGVDLATFDDKSELVKIQQIAPHIRLLLRLSTAGYTKSLAEGMTTKFGCHKTEAKNLLETAKQLGLDVKGVCFHIGLGAESPEGYVHAIRDAKAVFVQGLALGFKMNILDLGGGFPCTLPTNFSNVEFKEVAETICESLNKEFPNDGTVKIIGEPGSYFTIPSAFLAVNIIGKREGHDGYFHLQPNSSDTEYFINDGVYSSLRLYRNIPRLTPVVKPVHQKFFGSPVHKSKLWGQTCAPDVAVEECELPDMDVGDWLYFKDTGAYFTSFCTMFSGFKPRPVYRYICAEMKMHLETFIEEGGFKCYSFQ